METLKSYFVSAGFAEGEANDIADRFVLKQFNKGDLFVEEGKTSRHLGFIERGFVQYFINLEGVEKTTYSIGVNNFVASLVSFLKQIPSKENIRAIMDTTIWTIAFSQSKFSKHEISINGFRNPSIGAEYRLHRVSIHAGYYLTNFDSGVTTEFFKTGLTYWFLPVGKKENPLFLLCLSFLCKWSDRRL